MRISEKAEQMKNGIIFDKWSKYYVWLYPSYGITQKIEKYQTFNFDEVSFFKNKYLSN